MPNRRSVDPRVVSSRTDDDQEPRRKREHAREEGTVNEHKDRVKLRARKNEEEQTNGIKKN